MSTRSILALGLGVGPAVSLRRILDKERFETAVEEDAYGAKGKVIETVAKRAKEHAGLKAGSAGKGCFQYVAKDTHGTEFSYGLQRFEEGFPNKVDTADLNLEFTYCTLKKDTPFMFADQVKAAKPRGGKVGKTVGNKEVPDGTNYWWVGGSDSAQTNGFFYYDFVTSANGGAATEDVVRTLYPGTDGKGCEVLGLTNKRSQHTSYDAFEIVADCKGDVESPKSRISAEGLGSGEYTYKCTGEATGSAERSAARRVAKFNNPLGEDDKAIDTVMKQAGKSKQLPADTTNQGCFNFRVKGGSEEKPYQYGLAIIDAQVDLDGQQHGDFLLPGSVCEKETSNKVFPGHEDVLAAKPASPAALKSGLATGIKAGTPYWFVGKPPGSSESKAPNGWGYFWYDSPDADDSDYALVLGATNTATACADIGLKDFGTKNPVTLSTAIVKQCAPGISSPMKAKGAEINKLDSVESGIQKIVGEGKYWYEVPSALLDTNGVPIVEPEDEVPVAEILNQAQGAEQFAEFLEEELHEAHKEFNDSHKEMANKIWTLHHAANQAHEDYNGAVAAIETADLGKMAALAPAKPSSFMHADKPKDHVEAGAMSGRNEKTYEDATAALAAFAANKYPDLIDPKTDRAPDALTPSGIETLESRKELQRKLRVLADAKARYVAAEAALTAAIQELHDLVNAEAAPEGVSTSKPWYKRWWFYLLLVIVIIGVVAGGVYCFLTCGESTAEETVA